MIRPTERGYDQEYMHETCQQVGYDDQVVQVLGETKRGLLGTSRLDDKRRRGTTVGECLGWEVTGTAVPTTAN